MAVGDFNGDGKLDLAVVDQAGGGVDILMGNGNGTFSAETTYATGNYPEFVAVGDFNGDNIPDLAVTNFFDNDVSILVGNGNGTFGPVQNYQVGTDPFGLAVGDFTGDGKLDLAVANGDSNNISILLNQETATHFQVTAPPAVPVDSNFQLTVTALDSSNNTDGYYSGYLQFSSSDSAAFPSLVTLTNGVGVFSVSLRTAGSQTITASDATTASITGTSSPISVENPATHLAVFATPTTVETGNGFILNVVAQDQNNNTVTTYGGTVQVTCTDPLAQVPADTTLTDGVGVFAVVIRTAGVQSFTAADTVFTGISGTSALITVTAIAANHFGVTAPATAVTGSPTAFTVTAVDPYGNARPNLCRHSPFHQQRQCRHVAAQQHAHRRQRRLQRHLGHNRQPNPDRHRHRQRHDGHQRRHRRPRPDRHRPVAHAQRFRGHLRQALRSHDAQLSTPRPLTSCSSTAPAAAFADRSCSTPPSGPPPDTSFTFVATWRRAVGRHLHRHARQRPSGIKDASGIELDGTDSGIPGTNYIATFTVAATPSLILSIPDFARGPNSAANILLPNATGTGIPITLTGAANLTNCDLHPDL